MFWNHKLSVRDRYGRCNVPSLDTGAHSFLLLLIHGMECKDLVSSLVASRLIRGGFSVLRWVPYAETELRLCDMATPSPPRKVANWIGVGLRDVEGPAGASSRPKRRETPIKVACTCSNNLRCMGLRPTEVGMCKCHYKVHIWS